MIDLHSHILPGFDDGAPTLGASLDIARGTVADGISIIVATPHVNGRYSPDPDEIYTSTTELNETLGQEGIPLVVSPGAEIAVSELPRLDDRTLARLALGGSATLLVESPYANTAPFLDRMLFDLQARGFTVLLAHPERSPVFSKDPDHLGALVERGILCSITAGSLVGHFGRTVRAFALTLVQRGLVHNVSSDTHNTNRRPPGLSSGFEHAERLLPGVRELAPWLTQDVPSALLRGDPVPGPPTLELKPRGRRLRLGKRFS